MLVPTIEKQPCSETFLLGHSFSIALRGINLRLAGSAHRFTLILFRFLDSFTLIVLCCLDRVLLVPFGFAHRFALVLRGFPDCFLLILLGLPNSLLLITNSLALVLPDFP